MRSFLDFCNVYRRFLLNFARHAPLLEKKLKKFAPPQFELYDPERHAVDFLKENLITPLVLAPPRLKEQYTIATNVCDTHLGFVLLLEREDELLKPTRYWSCPLCKAETRYETTHKRISHRGMGCTALSSLCGRDTRRYKDGLSVFSMDPGP